MRRIRLGISATVIALAAALGLAAPAVAAPADEYLSDGALLSPFDPSTPAVSRLDPALLDAVHRVTTSARAKGVTVGLTSGWRSPEFQQQLFDDAVVRYGSPEIAGQYVASPAVSKHVAGRAVDVGPTSADTWLLANGPHFGLCQIYANEIWHFELAADYGGVCARRCGRTPLADTVRLSAGRRCCAGRR